MGDRGHIHLHEGDAPGVFFYAHWSGSDLPQIVRRALARKQRWDDAGYLNRIVFSELIRDVVAGETGYGIDAKPSDTGDGGRVVDVDHAAQSVTLVGNHFVSKSYTFDEYVAEDERSWPAYE